MRKKYDFIMGSVITALEADMNASKRIVLTCKRCGEGLTLFF